jgi:hypothetical protein
MEHSGDKVVAKWYTKCALLDHRHPTTSNIITTMVEIAVITTLGQWPQHPI